MGLSMNIKRATEAESGSVGEAREFLVDQRDRRGPLTNLTQINLKIISRQSKSIRNGKII